MTGHDVYLLSPEISLVGLALLVMGLDLVVRRKGLLTLVAVAGLALPLALSIVLWVDVSSETDGRMVGVLGALTVDKFALFFKFLILGVTGLLLTASVDYARRLPGLRGEFIGLILLSATGMTLLASATELITIYVALELTALPLIALSTFRMTPQSGEAGLKFLVLSGVSSALLLYGMVLVYGLTGSTYLEEIGRAVATPLDASLPFGSMALLMGVILIVAGFGFKIAAAPFHMWAPDVYQGAPTPVVAFLSVASKAAGFAILMRVFYTAFPALDLDWSMLFAILAVVSMTLGNLMAMVQSNIKRLLAYSTVAHAGYMLVGLAAVASRIQGDGISRRAGKSAFLSSRVRRYEPRRVLRGDGRRQQAGQSRDRRLRGPVATVAVPGGSVGLFPDIPDWHSAHGVVHRQDIPVYVGGAERVGVAGGGGRHQQRTFSLLLPAGGTADVHGRTQRREEDQRFGVLWVGAGDQRGGGAGVGGCAQADNVAHRRGSATAYRLKRAGVPSLRAAEFLEGRLVVLRRIQV